MVSHHCWLSSELPQETMLLDPERFRAVYVISDLWQTIGWNSIIYLAALSGVDLTLYDGRLQWMAPEVPLCAPCDAVVASGPRSSLCLSCA